MTKILTRSLFLLFCLLPFGCRQDEIPPTEDSSEPLQSVERVRSIPLVNYPVRYEGRVSYEGKSYLWTTGVHDGRRRCILGRDDFTVSIRPDDLAGSTVRGSYGFVHEPKEGFVTHATFRILVEAPEGFGPQTLLEERLRAGESRDIPFEVRIPDDMEPLSRLAFEVEYESDAPLEIRPHAGWLELWMDIRETRTVRPPPAPSNVILVTLDTTRQDDLGCYGSLTRTPWIDRVSSNAVLFRNAFSVAFGTNPSHASLFTSSYAAKHKVYSNKLILADGFQTLAEVLRDAGYRTAAFVSSNVITRDVGVHQGFDYFDDAFIFDAGSGLYKFSRHEKRADSSVEAFDTWLGKNSSVPFFAWVHFYDPHQPYTPPDYFAEPHLRGMKERAPDEVNLLFEKANGRPQMVYMDNLKSIDAGQLEVAGEVARSRYRGEVTFMDRHLGRILQGLKFHNLYESSMVILVSDHGENFLDHPFTPFRHRGLYQEVTRLLLVAKLPSRKIGGFSESLVGNIDIAPTVLDYLAIESPAAWQGNSFREEMEQLSGLEIRPHLFLEGAFEHEISIRTARYMYRELIPPHDQIPERYSTLGYQPGRASELYDLLSDPGEQVNLYRAGSDQERDLRQKTKLFVGKKAVEKAQAVETPEHLEALRALGYIE